MRRSFWLVLVLAAPVAAVAACVGSDAASPLSSGPDAAVPAPKQPSGQPEPAQPDAATRRPRMQDVSIGAFHGCALGADGSVWCWGDNGFGQLGTGTAGGKRPRAERVAGLPPSIAQISVGMTHSCAVAADESVWCWGQNVSGALGFDPAGETVCAASRCSATPRAVPGVKATQVRSLWDTTCALTSGGRVSCWGSNESGLLGAMQTAGTASVTPVVVTGLELRVARLGAAAWTGRTACALTSNREVVCWGANVQSNLGHPAGTEGDLVASVGNAPFNPIPKPVRGPDGALIGQIGQLAAGAVSCALQLGGKLLCWGNDSCGTLGEAAEDAGAPGAGPGRPQAVTVTLPSARSVEVGDAVCALLSDQRVACWGDDTSGIVGASSATACLSLDGVPGGIGARAPRIKPSITAVALSVGFRAAAIVDGDGNVMAWGKNEQAQLGHAPGTQGDDPEAQDRNPVPLFVQGLEPVNVP